MRTFSTTALMFMGILVLSILVVTLPGTANADLPPRPVITPVPTPAPTSAPEKDSSESESRARFVLNAGRDLEDAWTVVQWQGDDGVWHDVEGWRGQVVNGQVRWRVAEKDYGTGPFRWLIYDASGEEGHPEGSSFSLPAYSGQIMTVDVNHESAME